MVMEFFLFVLKVATVAIAIVLIWVLTRQGGRSDQGPLLHKLNTVFRERQLTWLGTLAKEGSAYDKAQLKAANIQRQQLPLNSFVYCDELY